MYEIQIIKYEPRTQEEKDQIEKQERISGRRYAGDERIYTNHIDLDLNKATKVLNVFLTEEEFKAIKKGVLEIM